MILDDAQTRGQLQVETAMRRGVLGNILSFATARCIFLQKVIYRRSSVSWEGTSGVHCFWVLKRIQICKSARRLWWRSSMEVCFFPPSLCGRWWLSWCHSTRCLWGTFWAQALVVEHCGCQYGQWCVYNVCKYKEWTRVQQDDGALIVLINFDGSIRSDR